MDTMKPMDTNIMLINQLNISIWNPVPPVETLPHRYIVLTPVGVIVGSFNIRKTLITDQIVIMKMNAAKKSLTFSAFILPNTALISGVSIAPTSGIIIGSNQMIELRSNCIFIQPHNNGAIFCITGIRLSNTIYGNIPIITAPNTNNAIGISMLHGASFTSFKLSFLGPKNTLRINHSM